MMPCREKDKDAFLSLSGEYNFTFSESPSEEELAAAEVIVGEPRGEKLKAAKSLRFLQVTWAGVDGLLKEGLPEGVVLANASGAFGQSIAEYVFAMIWMLLKKLHRYRDNQRAALWQDLGAEDTLFGKTVLVVGAGDIGTAVAGLVRPFAGKVVGIRRVEREAPPLFDEMGTLADLDRFLPEADVVVSALPGTPATNGLFNAERFSKMRPGSVFVNVGRGSLVDTDALVNALEKGVPAAAALDVVTPEPLPREHPLWKCENAVITPHITGASFGHRPETTDKIVAIAVDNLRRRAAGEDLLNLVDPSVGYRRSVPRQGNRGG